MADILTKRYWNTKPPLGSTLDYSHPLSQGLVGCWLMNERGGALASDLSRNIKPQNTNGANFYTQQFQGLRSIGYVKGIFVTVPNIYKTGANTIIWSGMVLGNAIVAGVSLLSILYDSAYSSPYASIEIRRSNTSTGIGFNYNLDGVFISGATLGIETIIHNKKYVYGLVIKNGFQGKYVNGILVNSATASGVITYSSTSNLNIGRYGSLSRDANDLTEYAYVYNRALSPSEIQSLYVAPYQMIKPRRIVFGYETGGSVNETITPAVLSLLSSLPDLSVNYDYVITPSTLDLTTTLKAPDVNFDSTITPSTLDLTASVKDPTLRFDYLHAVTALNLIATLLDPSVSTEASTIVSIDPIALTSSLLSPTVNFDYVVALSTLDLTAILQNTTVNFDFAVDVTALAITAGLLDPTISTTVGRTYVVFDSANNRFEIWVGGTEVARFNQDGSIDVNGIVNQNAF